MFETLPHLTIISPKARDATRATPPLHVPNSTVPHHSRHKKVERRTHAKAQIQARLKRGAKHFRRPSHVRHNIIFVIFPCIGEGMARAGVKGANRKQRRRITLESKPKVN